MPLKSLLLFFALGLAPAHAAALAPGDAGPSLALPGPDGQVVSADAWKGQVLIVNFWASWCAPCIDELPMLEQLDQRLRDGGARVVAVNIDRKPAAAMGVSKRLGLTLPVLMDTDNALVASCDPASLPVTWVIGTDGVVVKRIDGALDEEAITALEAEVRTLVAEAGDGAANP